MAEMGDAFLGGHVGIENKTIDNKDAMGAGEISARKKREKRNWNSDPSGLAKSGRG